MRGGQKGGQHDDAADELLMQRIQRWDRLNQAAVPTAVLAEIREILDRMEYRTALTWIASLVRDYEAWQAIRDPRQPNAPE